LVGLKELENPTAHGDHSEQRARRTDVITRSPAAEAETLLSNENAVFSAILTTIGKLAYAVLQCTFNEKSYCTHDIFLEIRTARFVIPTTHFVLQKHSVLGTAV